MDPASIQNLFRLLSEISHHQGAIAKASSSLETISRCKAYKRLGVVKFFIGLGSGVVCVCVCAGSESGESESEH